MDQQQQNPTGPGGRRLHIAHRRSPSELTPLMMEQLALQQQIEILQAQQQQMLNAHQQYAQMGLLQPGQGQFAPNFAMPHQQMAGIPQQQHVNNFQFPGQQGSAPPGAPTQPSSHRRNVSAMPGMGGVGGPPPAPSSGAAGTTFGEFSLTNPSGGNAPPPQRRTSGPERGHQRRHSLALPEAKKAAELAQQRRGQPGSFQFPASSAEATPSTTATASPASAPSNEGASPASSTATSVSSTPTQPALGGPGRGRGAGGHGRSQSLAVGMNGRGPVGGNRLGAFQFPPPMATADAGANSATGQPNQTVERRGSNPNFQNHGRSASRNYDGNWRNQNQNQQPDQNQLPAQQPFQPGHRTRASMGGSIGSFQFAQPNMMLPQAGQGIFLNPVTGQLINPQLLQQQQLAQLQLQQTLTGQQMGMAQGGAQNMGGNQQQQRKTLFTPYLPQANLPALLSNGQLVSGILRVNKKNRSDAYVTTQDGLLDADIFICGSKDRNRALEGDLVAIELLDVDEVWGQKREKEEKKKRKDISEATRGSNVSSGNADASNDAASDTSGQTGGMRRRGSLRQRPTQKKNDDVEVEGQSLLLVEEEEISDEQKPLYAGHVVAVIERVAGQMFSGTLGLLRPSSQATKEKQEAERAAREGHNSRPHQQERHQENPRIVWFKPTDKRVPLIAIPTEQAPRDFVENHQAYANRIFVACIKRWPITSLHPFGTLVEQLGEMGNAKVETDALLRDNNFGPDEFSDAVTRNVGFDSWALENEGEEFLATRKDFREEFTFSITKGETAEVNNAFTIKQAREGAWEISVHIADVTHFIKPNSLVDREAKKRGTAVELVNRYVPMLPAKLSEDLASLKPGEDRLAWTVTFTVEEATGKVDEEVFIGKTIIKNDRSITFDDVEKIFSGEGEEVDESLKTAATALQRLTKKLRQQRYGASVADLPALRLLFQSDDENVPNEENVFESRPAYDVLEEILIKTNALVAEKLVVALPEKAVLRRQSPPAARRLKTFGDRINRLGYNVDTSSSAALINSLYNLEDPVVRKGLETLLIKGLPRAKYAVVGKLLEQQRNHFVYNLPVYTHFTTPLRRYVDIIVQRQLEAALSNGTIEFTEDTEALQKTADQCNVKKDSAKNAQEQSIHIELCRAVDKRRQENGGELICEAIVICVYESAFDVLIPEYGFEKRVHCDQLPLKKAEFDKPNRVLELYWEKGTQSNVYVPEDERPRGGAAMRAANEAAAASAQAAKEKAAREQEEAERRTMDISSLSVNDVDALFDDDEDADSDPEAEHAGVGLNPPVTAPQNQVTQSMPGSPTRSANGGQLPHRTRSDPKMSLQPSEAKKEEAANKELEKWKSFFTLREEKGEFIQEVRELTRVPVFLKTELSKSPPCLTIRTLNPYAL